MADSANTKTFPLGYPFDFRGVSYREFTARRPKVRDLREFIRTVDKDGIKAIERTLSNLFEVEEAVVEGVIRSTFVLDEDGVVTHAWYNVKASGHVAKVMRDLGLAAA